MIPKSEMLPCGYRIVPYIYKGKFNFEISQRDMSLCDAALYKMDKEREGDRLDENYGGRLAQAENNMESLKKNFGHGERIT